MPKEGSGGLDRVFICAGVGRCHYCAGGQQFTAKEVAARSVGALAVNYVLGLISVVLVALAMRVPIPAADKISSVPWWAWIGGVLGILYGLAVVFLASQMGAAVLIATVVTGQLVFSVVVDHFGWVGFEVHRASLLRIVGCGLMVAGLALIVKF